MKPQHGAMVRTGGEGVGGTVRTSCHQVVDHYHHGHQVVDHDFHCYQVVDRPLCAKLLMVRTMLQSTKTFDTKLVRYIEWSNVQP